jgi:hypothetical protein
MKKTSFLLIALGLILLITIWNTPAKSYLYWTFTNDIPLDTVNIPLKNKKIVALIEKEGKRLAPTYDKVVCTEYVINVLEKFEKLSMSDKNKIRIITDGDLHNLIKSDSNVIKGVTYYLTVSGKGISIKDISEAKAGDFIQFWNTRFGKTTGHCGIIRGVDIDLGLISLYSSAPSTDGYGRQIYIMPEKVFIARMRE